MKKAAKKIILNVAPYVPGNSIKNTKGRSIAKQIIRLASNESPYGPSPGVLRAINGAAKEVNRYPDGDCYYLRNELAKRLKVRSGQLIFGNGSDELIVLAIRVFVNEGDEVIIARPSFLIYDIASRLAGAKIKDVPLKDFQYDLKRMKMAITKKTKIIFLGNPDNPSGMYLSQKEVELFLKGLRRDILVFFDEAYYEYVNARDYVNTIKLLKTHKNIVITRTFSKMYGLAGLRIGYGIANEELIDLLNRVREPFNVNSLAQAAAMACLKDKEYYANIAKKIRQQKRFLYQNLEKLGLDFVKGYTNFVLIKVENSEQTTAKLMKKGVMVRNMNPWGIKNYIRVSIGLEQENKKFIKALKKT